MNQYSAKTAFNCQGQLELMVIDSGYLVAMTQCNIVNGQYDRSGQMGFFQVVDFMFQEEAIEKRELARNG